jgi:hypothetical protein
VAQHAAPSGGFYPNHLPTQETKLAPHANFPIRDGYCDVERSSLAP